MKNILNKIEFHFTFLFMAISFILTGYFPNIIILTSIVLFHELGHYTLAKILNLNPQKIVIYPFGGITKLNHKINENTYKEIITALSGIIFQIIYFTAILLLYKMNIVRPYIFNIFKKYHYSILIFNLLPIHPLDGSKIITLLLSKIVPYKLSMKLNLLLSILTILIVLKLNYYKINYTIFMTLFIVLDNIIKYYKNINYIFNKFLLERYLYNIRHLKIKKIKKIDNMYKDKSHIIKQNNTYLTEKHLLNLKFMGKYNKNI